MFMHDFNGQLAANRMRMFETEAAQHRLGRHAPTTHAMKHVPLHRLLAASTGSGTVAFLITQTAPRVHF